MSEKSKTHSTKRLVTTIGVVALASSLTGCCPQPVQVQREEKMSLPANDPVRVKVLLNDPISASCADLRHVISSDMREASESNSFKDAGYLSQEANNLLKIYEIKRCDSSSSEKAANQKKK